VDFWKNTVPLIKVGNRDGKETYRERDAGESLLSLRRG